MSLLIQVGLFSSYNWLCFFFFFVRDQPALHHLKIMMLWRVSDSPLDFKRVCCVLFFFVVVGVSFEVSSSTEGVHSCYTMEKAEYQRHFLPPAILEEDTHCLAGRGCNVLLGLLGMPWPQRQLPAWPASGAGL